jgi:hypothetical protein
MLPPHHERLIPQRNVNCIASHTLWESCWFGFKGPKAAIPSSPELIYNLLDLLFQLSIRKLKQLAIVFQLPRSGIIWAEQVSQKAGREDAHVLLASLDSRYQPLFFFCNRYMRDFERPEERLQDGEQLALRDEKVVDAQTFVGCFLWVEEDRMNCNADAVYRCHHAGLGAVIV